MVPASGSEGKGGGTVGAYAAGATVERRYPGRSQEQARADADAQVQAFLAAGWKIASERWTEDASQGAPIGDAIATGAVSYLAGSGGSLVITYVAVGDADLPADLPVYQGSDPRRENLQTFAGFQVALMVVAFIFFVIVALTMLGQMGRIPTVPAPEIIFGTLPPGP